MREITGDIWQLAKNNGILITTNGMVTKNGHAIMSKGIAKDAKERFKGIHISLGEDLQRNGNHVFHQGIFDWNGNIYCVYTFPTKNDWRDPSDIELIKQSAIEMVKYAETEVAFDFYMLKVGCGNGRLKWEDVKPVIENILDDRFIVCIQ